MPPNGEIEIWFDFGSPYSYLSVMRIGEAAARHGLAVAWRPFPLGVLMREFGWESSPFVLQPAMGAYMWQDVARQAQRYGLPWRRPSAFPRRALLPSRVALLGADAPWCGEFCRGVMRLNFVEDREIDTPEAVGELLESLGLPAAALIAEAGCPAAKERLRAQTDEARRRGVFGAPTLFLGGEMFWGDDRLEVALERAGGVAVRR